MRVDVHFLFEKTVSDDIYLNPIYKININGNGLEKLLIPMTDFCVDEKAQERLAQASRLGNCNFIFLYLEGVPIGFCLLVLDFDLVTECNGDHFTYIIDYVFIYNSCRGYGYSKFMLDPIVGIISAEVRKHRCGHYYDLSNPVSVGGEFFVQNIRKELAALNINPI